VARIGAVIFAFGILVLLFVAYQLWGTSITTRLHQEALRKQFNQELAAVRAERVQKARPETATTTTQPTSGVVPVSPGIAPPEGQPIGTIDIPAIGAHFVVVQGTGAADLQLGPGHYENTPLPGQVGNAAIAGHRTTYLHPFYSLNALVAGNPIYVTTTQGRFRYDVATVQIVDPTDVAILNPTPAPTLTLTTCNPRYSASQRLVVQATLVSPPAAAPIARKAGATRPTGGSDSVSAPGLGGAGGSVWPAIAWGIASAALGSAVWLLARGRRWPARLGVVAVGTLAMLVLLFFFFQSITPLLPASF